MKLGQPSLDQLRIFLAVAEEGSFHAAAKRQGRAISAISYGIGQLEAQLGLTLFAREGSRRPELTEAGRALLVEAKGVADRADGLLAKARSLGRIDAAAAAVLAVAEGARIVGRGAPKGGRLVWA